MIQINEQPREKQVLREDGSIEVVDVFYTIQGEGPHVGRPAVFVRLAGCNLQCLGCDSDYTSKRRYVTPSGLLQEVIAVWQGHTGTDPNRPRPLIVFTGGEPFRQDFGECVRSLVAAGFRDIQVETNGTLYVDGFPYLAVDIICSPKTGALAHDLLKYIRALKYVVSDGKIDKDGFPTTVLGIGLSHVAKPWPSFKGEVYVQPEDELDEEQNKKNLATAVQLCLRFGFRLSVQQHKQIGLP
jgi:7-carboxy-7-deazaguanine synthase